MVNRVATFSYTNAMVSENMRLQTKYSGINTQISSGLISQDYKGISRDSQYLMAVESTESKLTAYNANANSTMATVNIMYTNLGNISDLANTMLSNVTAALGGKQVPSAVMASQATNALNETAGLLNQKIAGRYVFSGSDTDTLPVDLADPAWTPQTSPSVVNASYYQGNNAILSTQVSETLTISYGITANNSALEELFRAYNLIANNPGSPTELSEASTLIQKAIDDIANLRGVLSTQAKSMEDQITKNEQDTSYLKEVSSSIKEVDIPSASVYLTEIQTQLEASYAASVRILNMNLVNYL